MNIFIENRVQIAIDSKIHVSNSIISDSWGRIKDNSVNNPQHIRWQWIDKLRQIHRKVNSLNKLKRISNYIRIPGRLNEYKHLRPSY